MKGVTGGVLVLVLSGTFLCDDLKKDDIIDKDERVDNNVALMLQKESQRSQTSTGRRKRVTINPAIDPHAVWPSSIVYFRLEDTFHAYRDSVMKAIYHIQNETCVRFYEVDEDFSSYHIVIRRKLSCISFVGRSRTIPQPLILSSSCIQVVGEVIHYLLHAVGMWHTHQRSDRDQYVEYKSENVQEENQDNYDIIPSIFTVTLGAPYDYASVMHYNGRANIINGEDLTLRTLIPWFQRTIGQRAQMSFYDKLYVNTVFCPATCEPQIECINGGYLDPKSCTEGSHRCKCPDGYAGDDCSVVPAPYQGPPLPAYYGSCGGVVNLSLNDRFKVITSPGYTDMGFYEDNMQCTWLVKLLNGSQLVDANGQIMFHFEDDFGVFCYSGISCYHWVEIRYTSDLTQLGPRFCCYDSTFEGYPNVSVNGEILVIFKAVYSPTPLLLRRGFKLIVYPVNYEKCPRTDQCPEGEYCNPQTGNCDPCPEGYNGEGCRQDIDECEETSGNGCSHGSTCVNTQGSYYCDCAPGYGNVRCDQEINECDSEPCLNGGVCEDHVASYTCLCEAPYTGINCEQEIVTSTTVTTSTSAKAPTTPVITSTEVPSTTKTTQSTASTSTSTTESTSTTSTVDTTSISTATSTIRTSTPSITSTTTVYTTPTTRSSTSTTSTTTTEQLTNCPDGYWGDQCLCHDSYGGKGTIPGVKSIPCCAETQEDCVPVQSFREVKRCRRSWWGRTSCYYEPQYFTIMRCKCGRHGKCYPGYHLFGQGDDYYCAKEGYTGKRTSCECHYHHPENCGPWYYHKEYFTFQGDFSDPDKLYYNGGFWECCNCGPSGRR